MPDEPITPTPTPPGTEAQPQTPGSGTGDPNATVTDPAPSPTPEVDYKEKFAASTRENQRIMDENMRLRAIAMSAQQPQPQYAPPQQNWDQGDAGTEDEVYQDLVDGVLTRDPGAIDRYTEYVANKAVNQARQVDSTEKARDQRVNASMSACQEILQNPNSPLAQRTIQKFSQIQFDPRYSHLDATGDVVPVPSMQGMLQVNPHKLRQALIETKAEMAQGLQQGQQTIQNQSDYFTEPGQFAQPATPGEFAAQTHLTQGELDYCSQVGMSHKEYFDNLTPKLKAARLKAGAPLTAREALAKGM